MTNKIPKNKLFFRRCVYRLTTGFKHKRVEEINVRKSRKSGEREQKCKVV